MTGPLERKGSTTHELERMERLDGSVKERREGSTSHELERSTQHELARIDSSNQNGHQYLEWTEPHLVGVWEGQMTWNTVIPGITEGITKLNIRTP